MTNRKYDTNYQLHNFTQCKIEVEAVAWNGCVIFFVVFKRGLAIDLDNIRPFSLLLQEECIFNGFSENIKHCRYNLQEVNLQNFRKNIFTMVFSIILSLNSQSSLLIFVLFLLSVQYSVVLGFKGWRKWGKLKSILLIRISTDEYSLLSNIILILRCIKTLCWHWAHFVCLSNNLIIFL